MPGYIDLETGPLHWKDYGGQGPLIVLVHGLGGSIANWDAVGQRLAKHGRVTAIDLPGFGLSPPGPDWSLETHRDAIAGFIRAQGGPAVVVGNSLGGLLSEMTAAEYPDLVSHLILIAPATPPRIPDPNIYWPMAGRLLVGSTPGLGTFASRRIVNSVSSRELVNELLQRIMYKPANVPLELVEAFVEITEKRRSLPWGADAIPKTGQSIRRLFTRRSRFVDIVRDITAPTLVIQGTQDRVVSTTSVEWLCSLRLDWTLVQMDDTGHAPQIEAPMQFLSIVQPWLEAHLTEEMTA